MFRDGTCQARLHSWTQNKKTFPDNLDNDDFFALLVVSAKVESQADPVISRCIPT
jgi:hypothetical protein